MTQAISVSLLGTNYFDNINIRNLNLQLQQVTSQISTGKKATVYGQLDGQDNLSLSLHAQDDLINGYQSAISNVKVRTDSMDTSMTTIGTTLSALVAQMNTIAQGSSAPDLSALQAAAKTAMTTLQQQLNSTVDSKYIFGGALNDQAPVTDTSAANATVNTAVTGYTTGSAATIISNLNSLTDAQLGLNTNLAAAGDSVVRADDNLNVDYTVKGDETQYKQAMTGIAEIANLAYNSSSASDFWSLFNDAKARLTSANTTNSLRQGQLGVARNQLNSLATSHTSTQLAVETNISSVESADVATATTNLQNLQTQLQATYSAISRVSQLSLLNYLPAPA